MISISTLSLQKTVGDVANENGSSSTTTNPTAVVATTALITFICHNGYLAERDYGKAVIERYRQSSSRGRVSEPTAVYAVSNRAYDLLSGRTELNQPVTQELPRCARS